LPAVDQAVLEGVILRRNDVGATEHARAEPSLRTAVHEAGHAVWAAWAWGPGSVIAIGLSGPAGALGQTMLAEGVLQQHPNPAQLRRLVGMALAGWTAERLALRLAGFSAGAGHDLDRARRLIGASDDPDAQLALAAIWVECVLHVRVAPIRKIARRLLAEPQSALAGPQLEEILGDASRTRSVHRSPVGLDSGLT